MYIGLRVKYLLFLLDFNGTLIFSTDFRKDTQMLHENPYSGSQFAPCWRADGRADGQLRPIHT